MPEWSGREGYNALVKMVMDAGGELPYLRVNPLQKDNTIRWSQDQDVIYVSSDTARQINSNLPARAGKKDTMRENTKMYEVKFTDGTTEIIMAHSVEETATRIKFLGHVAGVSEFGSGAAEVIKSFKEDEVTVYRVIPVPEQNDNAVGKHKYRVNHTDGTAKDVQADAVMHAPGTDSQPGRYAIVTNLKGSHTSRTEYLVPENRVASIERVGAVTVVVVDNVAKSVAKA